MESRQTPLLEKWRVPMQSTFERRRIAPGHFWAKANNARLSAATLWHLSENDVAVHAIIDEVGYSGTPAIAYWEAFSREAAIALELIVKAVIAQQMTMRRANPSTEGVPTTHDLPALWAQAGLPKLGPEDRYRLLFFKSILMWSGRYATPRTAEAWEREWEQENEAFQAVQPPREGRLLQYPIPCGWPEFERLYRIAAERLSALQSEARAVFNRKSEP
jgi:hypothetical protein